MELEQQYTYTVPKGTISPVGINLIQSLIGRQRLHVGEWLDLNPGPKGYVLPYLPLSWDWVWLVQRGEYRGTFAKRLSQYYFKVRKLKCPPSFLQEVGNLARRHSSDNTTYTFDVSRKFPLREGQFGDSGSCYYWQCRQGVWTMLTNGGGMALRLYRPDGSSMARAWLVEIEDGLHVIFNGHGFVSDATLIIARMFAGWRGESYKRIDLENNYSGDKVLWIDGDNGYVVGSPERIAEIDDYDFHWRDIYTYTCDYCGEGVLMDDYLEEWTSYCSEECYYDSRRDEEEDEELEEDDYDSEPDSKDRR